MRAWRTSGAVALVIGLGAGVLGCSRGDDGSEKTISASEVCGGALSPRAVKSLSFLTGTKKYSPYSGSKDDLKKAAAALRDGYTPGVNADNFDVASAKACAIPNLKIQGVSDIQVKFNFATAQEADRKTFAQHARYKVGRNAFVNSDWAYIYFDCTSPMLNGSTKKNPAIIKSVLSDGALSLHRNQPKGTQLEIDKANLSVLNSVALKVAEKLQCEGNGGLRPNPTLQPASNGH